VTAIKKFVSGVATSIGLEVVRGYVVKRIREVSPDDIIDAIERWDVDLIGKLSKRDEALLRTVVERFGKYLGLLTTSNVFKWLMEDLPFYAGVIYGHPRGLKWLDEVISRVRSYVSRVASSTPVELVPIEQGGGRGGRGG